MKAKINIHGYGTFPFTVRVVIQRWLACEYFLNDLWIPS